MLWPVLCGWRGRVLGPLPNQWLMTGWSDPPPRLFSARRSKGLMVRLLAVGQPAPGSVASTLASNSFSLFGVQLLFSNYLQSSNEPHTILTRSASRSRWAGKFWPQLRSARNRNPNRNLNRCSFKPRIGPIKITIMITIKNGRHALTPSLIPPHHPE